LDSITTEYFPDFTFIESTETVQFETLVSSFQTEGNPFSIFSKFKLYIESSALFENVQADNNKLKRRIKKKKHFRNRAETKIFVFMFDVIYLIESNAKVAIFT